MSEYNKDLVHRLKIARGHMDKVISMVENEEYCLNITQQTQAVISALQKANEQILEHHLKTCVREAMVTDKNVEEKVKEIIEVFKRK
jgi:DNA-binding FrmR family transcriptional regulator